MIRRGFNTLVSILDRSMDILDTLERWIGEIERWKDRSEKYAGVNIAGSLS